MTMKFTILCDNSVAASRSGIAEHGFACYLESEEDDYLFDTGQGLGIVHNSIALKKDLSKIKAIDNWYVQDYAYYALKNLGWTQRRSK